MSDIVERIAQSILDNCPGVTPDGARYAAVEPAQEIGRLRKALREAAGAIHEAKNNGRLSKEEFDWLVAQRDKALAALSGEQSDELSFPDETSQEVEGGHQILSSTIEQEKQSGDYVRVPREPTEAMLKAARSVPVNDFREHGPLYSDDAAVYRAMISASPTSKTEA